MIEGSVDIVTNKNASGWIYNKETGRAADVVAVLHGRTIGEAPASLHRPDLERVGFGDGRCGFDLPFYEPVQNSDIPFVTVRPRGSNLSIPRTSDDTHRDIVATLMKRYPGAGRSRTVLGGFWTDRTDAMQILNGRISTGSSVTAVQAQLRGLIADGFVFLNRSSETDLDASALEVLFGAFSLDSDNDIFSDAVNTVAGVIGTDVLSALLRAMFDDVPVAYSFARLRLGEDSFLQASACEPFTSPAEVVAVYVSTGGSAGRIDTVVDSHEIPEFASDNSSRWMPGSAPTLPIVLSSQERPISTIEFGSDRLVVVGPGLIHRSVPQSDGSIIRILFAPRRNTPHRFLLNDRAWQETAFGEGMRARMG